MSLKISLFNARKLFRRTIQSFKSLFVVVATYQRLPNTTPPPPLFSFTCFGCRGIERTLSQRYRELDKFYTDFTSQGDGSFIENPIRSKQNSLSTTTWTQSMECGSRVWNENYDQVFEKKTRNVQKKMKSSKRSVCEAKISNTCKGEVRREERRCLVAKKLKELEAIDVEIQEVVYYYSLLTSPVYMEMFDKFFINIYADLVKLKALGP